jgi:hypothetical protein
MNIRQFEDGLLKLTFDAANKQQAITIEIGLTAGFLRYGATQRITH